MSRRSGNTGNTGNTLPADRLEALLATLRSRLPPELSTRDLDRWAARNRPLLLSRVRASLGSARPLLREEYGPLGAPRPGERGYRPPVTACGGAELFHRARALLGEAEFAWAWHAAEGSGEADPDGEQDFLELLEVPERDAEGQLLSPAARLRLGLWVTDLAMLTDPERQAGVGWSGGEDYLRLASAGEPIPIWLAAAMAEDALQPAGRLRLVNVSVEAACAFIAEHHSQLPRCNRRGLLFAIGAELGARLVAVATAGAPTGQWRGERVNPRDVLELTRVASDRTAKNASSMLVARFLDLLPTSGRAGEGPALFVTYSLAGEAGTPYRALADKGLRPVARVRGQAPSGARRGSVEGLPERPKVRWEAGERALPARWELVG